MGKYLLGTVLVFAIAAYLVHFGINRASMDKRINQAMDVPHGEYDSMVINKAAKEEDGWVLSVGGMRLYPSRKGGGTMCSTNVDIYFPENKNAKLVMKLRYNLGPFLAKPLREMTVEQAMKPESKDVLIKSLTDGYANQYGIKNMTKVVLKDFQCRQLK